MATEDLLLINGVLLISVFAVVLLFAVVYLGFTGSPTMATQGLLINGVLLIVSYSRPPVRTGCVNRYLQL
jgi:hypothetical protein